MKWLEIAKAIMPILGLVVPKANKLTGLISDVLEEAQRLEKPSGKTDEAGNKVLIPYAPEEKKVWVQKTVLERAEEHGFTPAIAKKSLALVMKAADGLHDAADDFNA